jgi:hypothetical protein
MSPVLTGNRPAINAVGTIGGGRWFEFCHFLETLGADVRWDSSSRYEVTAFTDEGASSLLYVLRLGGPVTSESA